MLVRMLCIHLLLVFCTASASNYSIFYTRQHSNSPIVTINVTSTLRKNVDELSFDILYSSKSSSTVLVDHTVCQTNCSVVLPFGRTTLLTFEYDDDNLISFYQFEHDETYLYYRGCYQPMDYLKCRYRREIDFELCICMNHLNKCTYEAKLSWDEIWCNTTTSMTRHPTTIKTPTTTLTTQSMETIPHRQIRAIANYSMMYTRVFDANCDLIDITVNVIVLLMPNDVMQVMFKLPRHISSPCANLMVNNMECKDMCVAELTGFSNHIRLRFAGDTDNEVKLIRSLNSAVVIWYDSCVQPLEIVPCRSRRLSGIQICICNGQYQRCDWKAPLLTAENICHDVTTTSKTTSTTASAKTTVRTTMTKASTISSTARTTSTTSSITSTAASTASTTTNTTSTTANTISSSAIGSTVTVTELFTTTVSTDPSTAQTTPSFTTHTVTDLPDTLKNLSESGVGNNNVSRILNETLKYSQARNDLSSTQIQEITVILNKSANLNDLKPEDSRNILHNLDCILSADSKQIQDGNTGKTLLSLLPTLVQNTNASQFDYLSGENLGFIARRIDCSSPSMDDGLLDFGSTFTIFNGSIPLSDRYDSIYISTEEICRQEQVTHVYLTVYRNRKLFTGTKEYRSYDSSLTIAQQGIYSNNTMELLQEQATSDDYSTEKEMPSRCIRQISLPAHSPVMSATVLSNGSEVTRLANGSTMTVIRFNVKNILNPLHGYFRVTWWDTKNSEWSTENLCETEAESDTIVAHCQHLTDFTLIVDGSPNDPNVCDTTLMDLGYAVNTLSIVSLVFLIFMNVCMYWPPFVANRTLRYLRGYSPPHTDFVSLAHKIALLLFYVMFTIFSDRNVSGKACHIFAALSYSLLMSSVLLTIFLALRITSMFCAIHRTIQVILLPSSSVTASVLLPFTASVLLLVLTNFFDRGDYFCWVRPDFVIYAVIIPISFVVLNAIMCTSLVCRRLFGTHRTLGKMVRYNDQYLCSKIVAVVFMQVSLGMPWVLQYFTLYSPYTTVWHYVFTIVIGSQGTILLLLFLYKRRRSMSSYRRSQQSRVTLVRDGTPSSR